MPGLDGTGPNGNGLLTGKGLGLCADAGKGYSRGLGSGFRRERRCGRGFRGFFSADKDFSGTDKEILLRQKEFMERRLFIINEQLERL